MNFLKTIESSLKKYKVFSEDLKVYRITLKKKLKEALKIEWYGNAKNRPNILSNS